MTTKEAYRNKIEAEMDLAEAKLVEFRTQAKSFEAEAREKYDAQIDALTDKFDASKAKLKELAEASEDAWESLKEGFEKAWDEMGKSINHAADSFKK
jgi:uncharacterized coiled-coil DUF342 family protein